MPSVLHRLDELIGAFSPDPWRPRWMPWAIAGFVGASALLLVGFLLDSGIAGGTGWFVASNVLSLTAFLVGVPTARKGFRGDWLLMAGAMIVWAVGNVLGAAQLGQTATDDFWQVGIMLSAAAFALTITAMVRLARRDGYVRGATVGLDSATYLVAVVLEWYVLVGQGIFAHHGQATTERVVAASIPLADGLLLSAVAALMSSRSAHALSSRALVVGCVAALAGDMGFARFAFGLDHALATWIPAAWMIQFAAYAVAGLASGRASVQPEGRVSLLSGYVVMTALVAPALATVYCASSSDDAYHLHPGAGTVMIWGTIVLAALHATRERRTAHRIMGQAAEMERTARTDHLTQLPNRRAGDRILDNTIAAVRGTDSPELGVALLDIDHFKVYNDTYGHQQGDHLLRAAALAWSSLLAGLGTIFRYGGEEFVVVLPHTCREDAEELLAALRQATPRGQSFSAGLAMLRPDDDATSLLGRADASLYAAKDAGRACTVAVA